MLATCVAAAGIAIASWTGAWASESATGSCAVLALAAIVVRGDFKTPP